MDGYGGLSAEKKRGISHEYSLTRVVLIGETVIFLPVLLDHCNFIS